MMRVLLEFLGLLVLGWVVGFVVCAGLFNIIDYIVWKLSCG